MGIRFELNCEVGKDIPMATLLADYDAVFVGAGTYRSMKAGLPNEEAPAFTMRCRSSLPTPNR